MGITRKTLTRHELIGLDVEVLDAQNESSISISGKIVDETQKSVVIKTTLQYKRIFKSGTLFRVALSDGEKVEIQGDEILGRPWERIGK